MAVVAGGRILGAWARALPILLVLLHLRLPQPVHADQQPVPAVASGVQQIHLAQGKDPTTMVISWLTPNASMLAPASQVRYGLAADALTMEAGNRDAYSYSIPAGFTKQNSVGPYPNYTSGWLHNVELTGLTPDQLYFYQVGDFSTSPSQVYPYTPPIGQSGILYFRTLPAPGQVTRRKDKAPLRIGVVADIGQGPDSQLAYLRMSQNSPDFLIFAGDQGYANCNGHLWDSFFIEVSGIAAFVPLMVAAGNHEVEWLSDPATPLQDKIFMSYQKRFRMPQVAPAVITDAPDPRVFNPTNKLCMPSYYRAGYEGGNSYFSYAVGPATFIHMNPYTNTNTSSLQYRWLRQTLEAVDRKVTPWVIAVYHNPWYDSNAAHQGEFETLDMQAAFEPLFRQHGVNFALNGHVHAYERSYPVYQFVPTPDATAYVIVGTGAQNEQDNVFLPRPVWSAYRNGTQWGTGSLELTSREKMRWRWHWNLDGLLVDRDNVTICNTALGYPTYCEGYRFLCSARLRGAPNAGWTAAQAAQQLVNLTSAATGIAASQMLVRKPSVGKRGSTRNAGLRVALEMFGLPKEAGADAAAQAVEALWRSGPFSDALGSRAVSVACGKPRWGMAKL